MTVMMLINTVAIIAVLIAFPSTRNAAFTYTISSAGRLDRRFDGVGGLSGSCSTCLLANCSATAYDQIMDYLFLSGFGASLQIIKVEIGVDVQSTDETEPSHIHSENDENYQCGYE